MKIKLHGVKEYKVFTVPLRSRLTEIIDELVINKINDNTQYLIIMKTNDINWDIYNNVVSPNDK